MNRTLMLLAALAVSCAPLDEEQVAEIAEAIGTCPAWDCGNAAEIWNGSPVGELDASGAAWNFAGVRLRDVHAADGTPLHLLVAGDRLVARVKLPGQRYPGVGDLYPGSLEGAVLTLVTRETGTRGYPIVIDRIGEVATFEYAPLRHTPTYRLVLGGPGTRREDMVPLCDRPLPERDDFWVGNGVTPDEAVVFSGDRYDSPTKRVVASGRFAGTWFNVGCMGSAAAKLHLMRHTEAAAADDFRTSISERQAVLKMITADYCGTGRSFTRRDEPVFFSTSSRERFPPTHPRLEAIWSAAGAVCLDEPRRAFEQPSIRQQIRTECASVGRRDLPPCASMIDRWTEVGYGLSANRSGSSGR